MPRVPDDETTRALEADRSSAGPNDSGYLAEGSRIGPYVVIDRLGAGGMGQVYLARDSRLHRKVALKSLSPLQTDDRDARSRILGEARAAARINHPNVAAVYDVLEEGSRAFIVMEFVPGENLVSVLRRQRLSATRVLEIGRQLAAGLGAAHAEGVVHRDLKPSNIQLTGAGDVKILDFGVARMTALPTSTTTTSTGPLPGGRVGQPGTPPYMAPEQLAGSGADERSDLYSMGVVLFEMITGRRPYLESHPIDLAVEQATPAPRADSIDRSIPAPLADLIERALKHSPRDRFQSAKELEAALTNLLSTVQVPSPGRRTWPKLARGLAVLAAFGMVWIAVTYRARPTPVSPEHIRTLAVLPLVNLSADASQQYLIDGMTDDLINTLGRINALRVTARTSSMAFRGGHQRLADIARELNVDAVLEGSVTLDRQRSGADHVRVRLNLVDPATESELWTTSVDRDLENVLALQGEIASTLAAQIRIALSTSDRERLASGQPVKPEAYKLYQLGKQAAGRRTAVDMKRALDLFQQAVAVDSGYAPAYAALADTYTLLAGDFGVFARDVGAIRAVENADRALAIDPNMAEAQTSLAFVSFFLKWDWDAARQHFEDAIALNRSYPTAHHWYGDFLSAMGREMEAHQEMLRALELDPKSEIIARDVAWPLFFRRDYDGAITQLELTLRQHPRYTAAERLLGRALVQKGRYERGIQIFKELSARTDQPRAAWDLAWAYALAGRREDALRTMSEGRSHALPLYEYDAALVWAALGDKAATVAALENGFANRDPTMVNLRHDPRLESLHGDPSFEALVSRMKFPTLQ